MSRVNIRVVFHLVLSIVFFGQLLLGILVGIGLGSFKSRKKPKKKNQDVEKEAIIIKSFKIMNEMRTVENVRRDLYAHPGYKAFMFVAFKTVNTEELEQKIVIVDILRKHPCFDNFKKYAKLVLPHMEKLIESKEETDENCNGKNSLKFSNNYLKVLRYFQNI